MRSIIALVLLLAANSAARADLILGANSAVSGQAGTSGLRGTYYHEGSGATGFNIGTTIALMNSTSQSGTFVSSAVKYSGTDSSTITAFLGADGASYRGATPAAFNLSDAILHLTGYFFVPTAETVRFALSNDDAVQFSIGGQVAISNNIGNSTTNVSFTAPGYYALDLVYGNTNYYGVGSALLNLTANGSVVTAANVVQSVTSPSLVPEPATLGVLAAAIVGALALSAVRRRRAPRV